MKKIIFAVFFIFLFTVNVFANLNVGLVAYYPFNGNSNDETENGNNCTTYGASLTEDRFGNTNSAYFFNGSSDYMDNRNSSFLPDGNNSRTISAWVKSTGSTDLYQTVISYGTFRTNELFGIERGGNPNKNNFNKIISNFWSTNNLFGTSIIEFNKWYHIVITYDQTNLIIYVNSKIESSEERNLNTVLNSHGLRIGTSSPNDGWHEYFRGVIDDIRIYDRALSESEVLELYTEPDPNTININEGLVAYYPFNGNTLDESGNGNDCTNHGATLTEDRFGNINSAYIFNGTSNYMDNLNPNLLPEGNNPRTISAWIMSTGTTELYQTIISYGTCSNNNLFGIERAGDSGREFFENILAHFWNNYSFSTSIIEFNKWYHIVITYDQTNLIIYVNSKVEATTTKNINTVLNSYGLRIGLSPPNDGWHQHFKGVIDDIRIYNRALSESEVLDIYNETKPAITTKKCEHLDWKQFEGSEYALTENFGTWYEAQIEANRCGGNLVIINDDDENSWLSQEFSDTYNRSHPGEEYHAIAWIGYFLNSQTENWEWVNEEPVLYVNEIVNFSGNGNFAYLLLSPHPLSPNWGNNPIHNSDYGYNPKGIIERTFSGCLSQERYCQAIETERQKWDVNNDGQIGLEEAIHALQVTSGLSNLQSDNIISEVCNNFDDDCDGEIDEGVKTIFYQDADNDSYGDINSPIYACKKPLGYVSNSDDCNDSDKNIHPDATETCNGKDDNCNNETDEDLPIITYCQDLDADSYGNPNKKQQACKQPSGYIENCDDCNDSNKNIHPGVTETCNGEDDNCNNETDEGLPVITYCQDLDGDNYGNPNRKQQACKQPTGYVENCDDCNDSDINVHPGATETCNGKDDNCDGKLKEVDIMRYWGEQYDHWTTNDSVDTGSEYFNDANLGKALCEPDGDKTIPMYSCQVNYSTVPAINLNVPIPNNKVDHYLRTSCSLVPEQYNPVTLNNGKPIFYLYKSPGPNRSLIRACFFPFFGNTFETNKSNCEIDCSNFDPTNCLNTYPENEGWACKCAEVGWINNIDCSELGYTSSQ